MTDRHAAYTWHIINQLGHQREGHEILPVSSLRLARQLDSVLDLLESDVDFQFFTLDGQAVLLEDYLSIRPEHFERVESLVHAGQLLIGPWYIQPDLNTASRELLIRNLLMGMRTSAVFGTPLDVAYLPEIQALPPFLPQILKGFGIETAIIARSDYPREFQWQGDDGSIILVGNLLGADSSESGHLLISHNWTPESPWQNLRDDLRAKSTRPDRIYLSNPIAYFREIKAKQQRLPIVKGDLGDATGIAHLDMHRLLTEHVEPCCAWADIEPSQQNHLRHPQIALQKLWRSVLENQTPAIYGGEIRTEVKSQVALRNDHVRLVAESLTYRINIDVPGASQDETICEWLIKSSDRFTFHLSTVKRPEDSDRNGIIVRGYNLATEPVMVKLTPWRKFATAEVVRLDETPIGGKLAVEADGAITFRAGPARILTFWLHD